MRALDRLLTIVVTATLTSAVWIVAGGTIMQQAGLASGVAAPAKIVSVPATHPSVLSAPPVSGATLVIPVRGKTAKDLTDTFSAARAGGERVHDAIDIMAAEGTPVIAAAPGRIEKLFLSKPGGNTIYDRSADGRTIYYYAHLKS
jgi:murein DD-endopeptidase MepM/ murein hydrolase activator NlpD